MNWCDYSLIGKCMKKTVGVSRYCEEHLKRQQKHAQWRLENGVEARTKKVQASMRERIEGK